jgi:hypothetical protein
MARPGHQIRIDARRFSFPNTTLALDGSVVNDFEIFFHQPGQGLREIGAWWAYLINVDQGGSS